jgi:hypothetical protein
MGCRVDEFYIVGEKGVGELSFGEMSSGDL